MAEHFFKKTLTGLAPSTQEAEEWLAEIPRGEILRIKASRPRNVGHLRKFFALLNLIYKNQSHYASVDDLLLAFKYHVNHGHWVVTRIASGAQQDGPSGERMPVNVEIFQPHSISFAKMDQTAFNEFYDKAIDFVVTEVIPGLDKGDLERELKEFSE